MSPPAVFKSTGQPTPQRFVVEKRAGEFIFQEGDLGTEMFILQEGEVEILREVDGSEVSLALLEKGDFFGEMSLLEELPRTASARARTDVKLLQIDGSTFDKMLRNNPEIAVRMMRKLSRRLRETGRLLREATGREGGAGLVPEMPPAEAPRSAEAGTHSLVHEASGMKFYLAAGRETTVGRQDPVTGIQVDVDLTPVDGQRSISRRHAKIYRQDDGFFVAEEIGTMNGTFVNDSRVETGVPVPVAPGDKVRFGLVTLRLMEG